MTTGTVKFFNEQKGYGFIQPDDGGKDAFVHISAVERSGMIGLSDNQRIAYDLEEDRRGKLSAINLKAPEEAAASDQTDKQPEQATDQDLAPQQLFHYVGTGRLFGASGGSAATPGFVAACVLG